MTINTLLDYFILYSFFGWVMESVYKTFCEKRFVNSGFLYGPFCPIYGFGAVIMLIFLKNFSNNIIVLFFVGFLVLSIWEYIVGFLLEKIFKTKYWDYTERKFNINGRVCLSNSLCWGLLSIGFIRFIDPPVQNLIDQIPIDIRMYVRIILYIYIIIDLTISVIIINNINISITSLVDITKNIKVEIEKLKQYAGNKAKESEKLQYIIDELKKKQDDLKIKIEKQTERLRRAFPTMKSTKIAEIFNQTKERIRKYK